MANLGARAEQKRRLYNELPKAYRDLYEVNKNGVPTASLGKIQSLNNDFKKRGEVAIDKLSPSYFDQAGKDRYKKAVADALPPNYKDNIPYNKKGVPSLSAEKMQRLTQYSAEGLPAEYGLQMIAGKMGKGGNLTIDPKGAQGIALQQMLQELSSQRYQRELMRPEILREQGYTVDETTGKLVPTEEEATRRKYDEFLQKRQLLGIGYGIDPATGEMKKLSEDEIKDQLSPEERDAYELRRMQQQKVKEEFNMFTPQERERYARSFQEADLAAGMVGGAADFQKKSMDFAGGILDRSQQAADLLQSRYGLISDAEAQLKDTYGLREQAGAGMEDVYNIREQMSGALGQGLETSQMADENLRSMYGMLGLYQNEMVDALGQRRSAADQLQSQYGLMDVARSQMLGAYGGMEAAQGQMAGIRGLMTEARGDYGETSQRVQDLLAGKGEVSAGLEYDLKQQEDALRERLRRQYGPNYENTTGGMQAIMQFKTQSNISRDTSRREQLPAAIQAMQSFYGAGIGAGTSEAYQQSIGAGLGELFQQTTGAGTEALYSQASGAGLGQLYQQAIGAGTGEMAQQAGGNFLSQLYAGAMGSGSGELAQQAYGGLTSELFQQAMGRGSEELYRQTLGWGAGEAASAGLNAFQGLTNISSGGSGSLFYGRQPSGTFMGTNQYSNEASLYGAISGNQAPQMTGILSQMPTYGGEGAANAAQQAYIQGRQQTSYESQIPFDQWYKQMDVMLRDKGLNIQALQGTSWMAGGGSSSSGGSSGLLGTLLGSGLGALGDIGSAYLLSDKRFKKDIKSFEGDSLSIIKKLRPVTFTWKGTGASDIGLIAQEVKEVIPEAVEERSDTLFIQPLTLITILMKAVQILSDDVQKLKDEKEGA